MLLLIFMLIGMKIHRVMQTQKKRAKLITVIKYYNQNGQW